MIELLQIFLGWYAADLITGVVHLLFDRYTWMGPLYRDAQQHHEHPELILSHSTWSLMWKPIVGSIALIPVAYFFPWFGVPLILGGIVSVKAHVYAHANTVSWSIAALQGLGIILSSWEHRAHHRDGHKRGYASLCGWSNPLIDSILDLLEYRWSAF